MQDTRTVNDRYPDAVSLPPEQSKFKHFGTDIWFKLTNTPPEWGDRLLQVDIYAWDANTNTWELSPIASSDRAVWGKGKLWQYNLTLLVDKGSERALQWKKTNPTLSRGRYLVKVHVDLRGRLAKDWSTTLDDRDFVGSAELQSSWPVGYGQMTTLDATKVKKE